MNGITLISLHIHNHFLNSINSLIIKDFNFNKVKKKKQKGTYGLLVREIMKKSTLEQRLRLLGQARRRQCRNPDRQTHHRRLHTRHRPRLQSGNLRRRRRLRTKRRRLRKIGAGGGEGEDSVSGEKGRVIEERMSGGLEMKRRRRRRMRRAVLELQRGEKLKKKGCLLPLQMAFLFLRVFSKTEMENGN